jgi:hypothetical protein
MIEATGAPVDIEACIPTLPTVGLNLSAALSWRKRLSSRATI